MQPLVGGAGAAVGSKAQGGSNRNATYSGVGGAIGSAVGNVCLVVITGAGRFVGAIGGGAGAAIEERKIMFVHFQKALHGSAFFCLGLGFLRRMYKVFLPLQYVALHHHKC